MAGALRQALRPGALTLVLNFRSNGLRKLALLYWLKQHRFLPMLWLNTVAVRACILSKFSSGRTS
ncbi:hypothetical protein C2M02_24090 [Serratia marcescens subsp. marcescens ATCC 13880]|nr:hypothetical protein C2M02_24090 [Serratia marcescens subsp. marcescens ATCC 13880]